MVSVALILGLALILAQLPSLGLPYQPVELQRVQALARGGALGSPHAFYAGLILYLPVGDVQTLAGNPGQPGADDGIRFGASFNTPADVAASGSGIALVADKENHLVRLFFVSSRAVVTLAGAAGQPGSADGVGSAARFNQPTGVAIDNLARVGLVADSTNHVIRRIDIETRAVVTLAGAAGQPGSADGIGAEARFNNPVDVALSPDGRVALVADTANHVIRRIDMGTNTVTTLAGAVGQAGSADGVGSAARFSQPASVAFARSGAFALVADFDTRAIRLIDLATARVSTLATLTSLPAGPAPANGLTNALSVSASCDDAFAIFADGQQHVVGAVELSTRAVSVVAGGVGQPGYVDGSARAARFHTPTGISPLCDTNQAIVADSVNAVLRSVNLPVHQLYLPVVFYPKGSDD